MRKVEVLEFDDGTKMVNHGETKDRLFEIAQCNAINRITRILGKKEFRVFKTKLSSGDADEMLEDFLNDKGIEGLN